MKTPVVLITGALTGIGRATALAYAKDGAKSSFPADTKMPARRSPPNCALSVPKPSSCRPTCGMTMTSATLSIGR